MAIVARSGKGRTPQHSRATPVHPHDFESHPNVHDQQHDHPRHHPRHDHGEWDYASPLTVTTSGYIDNAGVGDGVYGPNTHVWTVVNYGRVHAQGGIGIDLQAGGLTVNQAGGTLTGVRFGVYFHNAAGSLNNAGSIYGNIEGVRLHSGGNVVNQKGGTISGFNSAVYAQQGGVAQVTNAGFLTITGFAAAVEMAGGGALINQAGGTIAGKFDGADGVIAPATFTNSGVITGGNYGVRLLAGGTVADAGTIAGTAGTAVSFAGTVDNRLILYPGYTLGGKVIGSTAAGASNTLELAAGPPAASLAGLGTEFLYFGMVTVDHGADWAWAANNTFASGATLFNAGTIVTETGTLVCAATNVFNSGTVSGRMMLTSGGYVSNVAGGLIQGGFAGLDAYATLSTIANAGTIIASGTFSTGAGIRLRAGGSVNNVASGLIKGYYGIDIQSAATVANAGTIVAIGQDRPAVKIRVDGSLGNFGTILATGSFAVGVALAAGGTVSNSAVASLIQGGDAGVAIYDSSGFLTNGGTIASLGRFGAGVLVDNGATVVDSGTIVGGDGTAILFDGTTANRLALYPGFVIGGVASGSAFGPSNTLEMASGSAVGTLSGVGTNFVDFGTVTVDAGADWVLLGGNTIGSTGTLAVGGSLADLGNLVVAAGGTLSGILTVAGGGSAEFQGALGNTGAISFRPGGTVMIDDLAAAPGGVQTQQFNAAIGSFSDGDRLRIADAGLGNYDAITAASAGAYDVGTGTTPLVLTSGGATIATLTLNGNYAGDAFGVSVAAGGLQTIGMQLAPDDFNGDGTGDVLFQYAGDGRLSFAAMRNGAATGYGFATGGLGTLSAVGHGDIDGNGIADVVVQDPNSGQVYVGEEDGSGSGNPNWVIGPDAAGWTVTGTGDVQSDGRSDLVLQDAAGDIAYYDTRGNDLVSVGTTPGWNVVGAGDVNGDGYADIVVQDQRGGSPTDGQIAYANMAGGAFQGWANVATTPGWNVKAVADLTGDGFADIVVQSESGTAPVAFADMQGGQFTGWGTATTPLSTDYVVADTSDVFGNGHADLIVQQQSTGNTYYAAEGSTGFQGWGYVATALGPNYHIV